MTVCASQRDLVTPMDCLTSMNCNKERDHDG